MARLTCCTLLLVSCVAVALSMPGVAADEAACPAPPWLDRVQTYGMVPLTPERAAAFNITVNGIWGGIGGVDPVLTHDEVVSAVRKRYRDDAQAFVEAMHDAGMLAVGVVNGLEGFDVMRDSTPGLTGMACRDAAGKPLHIDKMFLMCTNNPHWLAWEYETGKRAIDAGADLVQLDTPMSSSFIAGMLGGGFCPHCMETFQRWIETMYTPEERADQLGLDTFIPEEIIPRLAQFQRVGPMEQSAFLQDTPDARLYQAFVRCQELASYCTRKTLIDRLRAYACAQGRRVAFSTNAADMGAQNPGGHWIRGLMFADIFDLFAYEQNHLINGMPTDDLTPYPRGKWAPYTKLAYAVHGRRSPAVIHAGAMGKLLIPSMKEKKTFNAWMAVQAAEAFAANGAHTVYQVEPRGMTRFGDAFWRETSQINAFIHDRSDCFEGPLTSGSRLALLVLMNERGRTVPGVMPSYLGFALGLTETNRPFDVLFGGDGRYVQDRLTFADVAAYDALIVPSPIDPTPNQAAVLQQFVREGGMLACQEPERLGLGGDAEPPTAPACITSRFAFGAGQVYVLRGEVTPVWTDDAGANFLRDYGEPQREAIGELADSLGTPTVLPGHEDGLVCAFPIVQPDRRRLIVHLVNYDVDIAADRVRPKRNIRVALSRPGFLSNAPSATLMMPGVDTPLALDVTATADGITCTVPRLGAYAILVISD